MPTFFSQVFNSNPSLVQLHLGSKGQCLKHNRNILKKKGGGEEEEEVGGRDWKDEEKWKKDGGET